MKQPHSFTRTALRCSALRNLRSAGLAVAIVMLPEIIMFMRHGTFTRETLRELAHALAVAALVVLFNYVQRLARLDEHALRRREALRRRRLR